MDRWIAMAGVLAFSLAASSALHAEEAVPTIDQAQAPMPFLGGFLRETRIVYPLAVGKREAQGEHRYDSPLDGVAVRYAEDVDAEWIDVYFYPAGVLTPDDVRAAAESERDVLKQHWLQGPDARPRDISDLQPMSLPARNEGDEEARLAWLVDLTMEADGVRRNSAMVVAYDNLYLVQARYTSQKPRVSRRHVRREAEKFVEALMPRLAISSTGGCWQPLPIEKLAADAAVPEGSLLSITAEGDADVHLFPDRVLTADPQGAAATAAMVLGMQMQGRLHEGCDGAESLNPVVPQGMREIRIDYRLPASDTPPVAAPRVRRVGVG